MYFQECGIAKSEAALEDNLVESVLDMLVDKDECASAGSVLESYSGYESCKKLLRMENQ